MFQLINYWSLGSNDALWSQRFSVFVPVQCPLVVRPDGSEKRRNSPKSSNERRELQFLWLRRIDRVREFLHYNRESRGGGANGCAVLCVFRVRACVCTRLWIILFERNCWTRSRSHQTVWALISMNAIFFQFFFLRIHGLTLFFCFIKK